MWFDLKPHWYCEGLAEINNWFEGFVINCVWLQSQQNSSKVRESSRLTSTSHDLRSCQCFTISPGDKNDSLAQDDTFSEITVWTRLTRHRSSTSRSKLGNSVGARHQPQGGNESLTLKQQCTSSSGTTMSHVRDVSFGFFPSVLLNCFSPFISWGFGVSIFRIQFNPNPPICLPLLEETSGTLIDWKQVRAFEEKWKRKAAHHTPSFPPYVLFCQTKTLNKTRYPTTLNVHYVLLLKMSLSIILPKTCIERLWGNLLKIIIILIIIIIDNISQYQNALAPVPFIMHSTW